MWESIIEALAIITDPSRLPWLFLGIGLGILIGILPGLGGAQGMAIMLPFVFGMDPINGVAMMVGMISVMHTADTFPSVLLGIPGSAGSQAVIMDGYPLAKQGKGMKALSAAFTTSMVGGLIGAVVIVALIGALRPIISQFGSPELLMLSVLGLSMVAVLSKGAPIRGLLGAALGLLIGAIGAAPATPAYRFTFDIVYLYDGLPIAVLALGLFALPEMLDLLVANRRISAVKRLEGKRTEGAKAVVKNKGLVVRSSLLGTAVGMIPGLGGAVVDWLAYGMATQTRKNPEKFGTGDIRGVIAPESANNAKEAGGMLPTLLFGIPGSSVTAILMVGLIMLGIQPGPNMADEGLSTTLVVMWTLAIANVVATLACLALTRPVARIAYIRANLLVPFLLVVLVIAAYQSSRHWGDILAFLLMGLLGVVLKRLGWSRPAVIIGFVLSTGMERTLWISMNRYGTEWMTRPIVLILAVLTVALIVGAIMLSRRRPAGAVDLLPGSTPPQPGDRT